MKRSELKRILFWAAVATVLAVIYWPLLVHDPILNRDDPMLLAPLMHQNSLHDVWRYSISPTNPDLQPVRDFSLMADIWTKRFFGWRNFHLHNLVLWFFCCIAFARFLRRFTSRESSIRGFTFFFAIHPMYVMTVGWIAAQKHLLAFLFFLLALNAYYAWKEASGKKRKWLAAGIISTYTLSVFSQPIYVFLPFWFYFSHLLDSKRLKFAATRVPFAILASMALMPIFVVLNILHYRARYILAGENPAKLSALDITNISAAGDFLLALGRYFYQIVVTTKYAVIYARGSLENMIGLALVPLFVYACGKVLGWKETTRWFSLFLICLIIVLTKIRTLFISDTYLLGASIGIWLLLLFLWEKFSADLLRWRRTGAFLLALLAGALTIQSVSAARTWQSDYTMWKNSYTKESNCFNSENYALTLLKRDEIAEAVDVLRFHFRNQCKEEVTLPLYYLFTYYSPELSAKQKIGLLLSDKSVLSPVKPMVLAALLLKQGREKDASGILDKFLVKNRNLNAVLHRIELKPLLDSVNEYCRSKTFKYCWVGKVKPRNVD